jgi:hypothetical protein
VASTRLTARRVYARPSSAAVVEQLVDRLVEDRLELLKGESGGCARKVSRVFRLAVAIPTGRKSFDETEWQCRESSAPGVT